MAQPQIHSIDESSLETIIGDDVWFKGEMTLTDPILIKGIIEGTIASGSNLYVDEHAILKGTVDAPVVSIRGQVVGTVHAQKHLELFKTGTLNGKVHTSDLIIQSGSKFNGECAMKEGNDLE